MFRKCFALCLVLVGLGQVAVFAASSNPEEIALAHLRAHLGELQLTELDLGDYVVSDEYVSDQSGVTHVYLNQTHNGIPVFNGILGVHLDKNNKVFHVTNRWISSLATQINTSSANISATDAILHVADHLNLIDAAPPARTAPSGRTQEQIFEGGQLSLHEIPVGLVYYHAANGEVLLAWKVNIRPPASSDWWDVMVDVQTGVILDQFNWTVSDQFEKNNSTKGDNHAATKVTAARSESSKLGGPAYRALPLPLASPDEGAFELINNPANATASPFGWHDTNGVVGAEFTTTRGNNVHAYEDRNGDNVSSNNEPNGGAGLVFDIVADLGQAPSTYTAAATVNLFVWNNYVHDILVFYGFDEVSGNFQSHNYTGQGQGNDQVRAEAQDNADGTPPSANNANFSTPPEGSPPRMQMFEWIESAQAFMTVNAPASIAGTYLVSGSSFGNPFPNAPGLTADFMLGNDGTGTTSDGCEPLIGFTAGRVAVLDRGGCEFGVKVLSAQNAGAIAAVVINNSPIGTISMGPGAVGAQVTIPSLMVTQADGNLIRDALLTQTVNATFTGTQPSLPNRDSDFDNGVIAHEYGHGVSNRLTGGPNNTTCLANQEQMGEGWSDFLTFALTRKPGDTGTDSLGVGTYVSFQPLSGGGIRPYPYSTNLAVNPLHYSDISLVSVPHGVGTVWCSMLWDLYWALVDRYGFDEDIYGGTGGNNMCIRLVLDGMKLQPCSPGFVDGRDAILAADQALNGGANSCLIWDVFARRGLGFNASQGSTNVVNDGVEDYTPHPSCCVAVDVTSETVDLAGCTGDSITMSVTATGSDLTYQWLLGTDPIQGATSAEYTINALDVATVGAYSCVVANTCSNIVALVANVSLGADLTYTTEILTSWTVGFPEPYCGDINSNGILDVLDVVNAVQPPCLNCVTSN